MANHKFLFDIDMEYRDGQIEHLTRFSIGGLKTLLQFFGQSHLIKSITVKITKHEKV